MICLDHNKEIVGYANGRGKCQECLRERRESEIIEKRALIFPALTQIVGHIIWLSPSSSFEGIWNYFAYSSVVLDFFLVSGLVVMMPIFGFALSFPIGYMIATMIPIEKSQLEK